MKDVKYMRISSLYDVYNESRIRFISLSTTGELVKFIHKKLTIIYNYIWGNYISEQKINTLI